MKKIISFFLLLSLGIVTSASCIEFLSATILGSGSPMYDERRAGASVLISSGETNILVDMGNGTQANLSKSGINPRKLSSLLFTHHHLDHNEEFVPILIRSILGRHHFNIIGPPGTVELTEANIELYKEDIAYRLAKSKRTYEGRKESFDVRNINGNETFSIDDIYVSTLKVPHTIHTIAYRFDYKNESIVVTGDLTYTDKLPAFAQNADYMIIDSGGMIMKDRNRISKKRSGKNKKGSIQNNNKTKQRAHLNLHDSSFIANKANVKNLVYTHFVSGEVDKDGSLLEIRKNYTGNVIFGEDLLVLNKK